MRDAWFIRATPRRSCVNLSRSVSSRPRFLVAAAAPTRTAITASNTRA